MFLECPQCPECGGDVYLAYGDGKYGLACKNGHVLYAQITVVKTVIAKDATVSVEFTGDEERKRTHMPPTKDFWPRLRISVEMLHACIYCGAGRAVDRMMLCDKCLEIVTTNVAECVAEQIGREKLEACPKCGQGSTQS